ncbi:hypothetical protein [Sciscionella marina]|uniref:hypothetical protein n=1 Tax=Sciscionella marina TaxID=508770 RepID=UPI00035ED1A7|nr:hypothetical protein [Sciscionella marina]
MASATRNAPARPGSGRRARAESAPFHGKLLTGTGWFEHYYHGERVAILASGAEAASILPEVLHTAETVTVFEETSTWVTPLRVPGPLRGLASRAWLRLSVGDAWTRRQLTPNKRFDSREVTVSPSYYAALQNPRTRLIHWPAYAIAVNGIRSADGVEYQVDTIIVGATSRFAATVPTTAKESAR